MSRQWVQQLVKRYQAEGAAAFVARTRRPHHNPRAVDIEVEDHIVRLRKQLTRRGLDAGADTIATHLAGDPAVLKVPAVSTIWRIFHRRGLITPQPANARAHPGNVSKPSCPTSAGKPTSPTGGWPTTPMWKSCAGLMTTPATPSQSPRTAASPALC
jgi:Homeodomain-like domain